MLRAGLFLSMTGWVAGTARSRRCPVVRCQSAANCRASNWGAGLKAKFTDGFVYSDAQVNDARLVVENANAEARGADVRVGVCASWARNALPAPEGANARSIWQATIGDAATGARETVHARAIVNASGPWVKALLSSIDTPTTKRSNTSGFAHHRATRARFATRLHSAEPGRPHRLVIPYFERFSLIGTTDVPVAEYETPAITDDETQYLLDLANTYLAKSLARRHLSRRTRVCVHSMTMVTTTRPQSLATHTLKLDTEGIPGRCGAPSAQHLR